MVIAVGRRATPKQGIDMLSRRVLRTKVIKSVYAYMQSEGAATVGSEKGMVESIDKSYDLYLHMLALMPHLVAYALERQEMVAISSCLLTRICIPTESSSRTALSRAWPRIRRWLQSVSDVNSRGAVRRTWCVHSIMPSAVRSSSFDI